MKIQQIDFGGYKFSAPGKALNRLRLAPLTIVFGKNNSGKSATVHLPYLLLGGLACDDERILPLESMGMEHARRFIELIHLQDALVRPRFRLVAEVEHEALDFTVELFTPNMMRLDEPPRVWSFDMSRPEDVVHSRADLPVFHGLLPAGESWSSWRTRAQSLLKSSTWLGPTRARAQTSYSSQGSILVMGADGRSAPHWLYTHAELAEAVGTWYEQNMGCRLFLDKTLDSFALRIGQHRDTSVNLAQAGEGLQQVLPVVTQQCWRQQGGHSPYIDVIEQPEIHLHAAAQSPLADLFIESAKRGEGQLLVETNSKQILLRVQRRVAEGRFSKDLLRLYYLEKEGDLSRLREMTINDDGEVDGLPDDVFDEGFREVAAIRRAQRERRV